MNVTGCKPKAVTDVAVALSKTAEVIPSAAAAGAGGKRVLFRELAQLMASNPHPNKQVGVAFKPLVNSATATKCVFSRESAQLMASNPHPNKQVGVIFKPLVHAAAGTVAATALAAEFKRSLAVVDREEQLSKLRRRTGRSATRARHVAVAPAAASTCRPKPAAQQVTAVAAQVPPSAVICAGEACSGFGNQAAATSKPAVAVATPRITSATTPVAAVGNVQHRMLEAAVLGADAAHLNLRRNRKRARALPSGLAPGSAATVISKLQRTGALSVSDVTEAKCAIARALVQPGCGGVGHQPPNDDSKQHVDGGDGPHPITRVAAEACVAAPISAAAAVDPPIADFSTAAPALATCAITAPPPPPAVRSDGTRIHNRGVDPHLTAQQVATIEAQVSDLMDAGVEVTGMTAGQLDEVFTKLETLSRKEGTVFHRMRYFIPGHASYDAAAALEVTRATVFPRAPVGERGSHLTPVVAQKFVVIVLERLDGESMVVPFNAAGSTAADAAVDAAVADADDDAEGNVPRGSKPRAAPGYDMHSCLYTEAGMQLRGHMTVDFPCVFLVRKKHSKAFPGSRNIVRHLAAHSPQWAQYVFCSLYLNKAHSPTLASIADGSFAKMAPEVMAHADARLDCERKADYWAGQRDDDGEALPALKAHIAQGAATGVWPAKKAARRATGLHKSTNHRGHSNAGAMEMGGVHKVQYGHGAVRYACKPSAPADYFYHIALTSAFNLAIERMLVPGATLSRDAAVGIAEAKNNGNVADRFAFPGLGLPFNAYACSLNYACDQHVDIQCRSEYIIWRADRVVPGWSFDVSFVQAVFRIGAGAVIIIPGGVAHGTTKMPAATEVSVAAYGAAFITKSESMSAVPRW